VQMVGLNIGLLLLAGFMVLAIGNDISRLFWSADEQYGW
jgi:regulator of sigma E protease